MKPNSVRLFVKPYCPWCHQAMQWLEDRKVKFDLLDVVSDATAYSEMIRLSNQTLAPVIEVDGQVLADFGASELQKWWRERGYDR